MESHLLQMRGLKQEYCRLQITHVVPSHLLQLRGLKQETVIRLQNEIDVASFTDAWIETEGIIAI